MQRQNMVVKVKVLHASDSEAQYPTYILKTPALYTIGKPLPSPMVGEAIVYHQDLCRLRSVWAYIAHWRVAISSRGLYGKLKEADSRRRSKSVRHRLILRQ